MRIVARMKTRCKITATVSSVILIILAVVASVFVSCSNSQTGPSTVVSELAASIRPPITRFLLKDRDNIVYLTDYVTRGQTITVSDYWLKENGYWVHHRLKKDFPLNIEVQLYPSGGEFGNLTIQSPKYFVFMADGVVYATSDEIISVTPAILRVSRYFIRETTAGRWYYEDGSKDILNSDARIQQMQQ